MSGWGEGDVYVVGDKERIHKARKEHECDACGETIRVGDKYCYHSQVTNERDLSVIKRCMRCEYIYRTLCADLEAGRLAGEWVYPDLGCGHKYSDTHKDPMPDHLARVAFMTIDELQTLDFTAIDNERRLTAQRKTEVWSRKWGRFDDAVRENAKTCELERQQSSLHPL